MANNDSGKMYHFSFGVPASEPELLQWLQQQKDAGWGVLSRSIRQGLKKYMNEDTPPKWFEEWVTTLDVGKVVEEGELFDDLV